VFPTGPLAEIRMESSAQAVYRAEKDKALRERRLSHLQLMAEAQEAFRKMLADAQLARKGGRPKSANTPAAVAARKKAAVKAAAPEPVEVAAVAVVATVAPRAAKAARPAPVRAAKSTKPAAKKAVKAAKPAAKRQVVAKAPARAASRVAKVVKTTKKKVPAAHKARGRTAARKRR
jgi:hypothetical protein